MRVAVDSSSHSLKKRLVEALSTMDEPGTTAEGSPPSTISSRRSRIFKPSSQLYAIEFLNPKVKTEMAHQVLMVMSHLRIKFEVFPLKLRKMDQTWRSLPQSPRC